MSFLNTGDASNYTIGGLRLFFSELLEDDTYTGLLDLGNIVSGSIASEIDELDHFTAKTGTRTLDRSLVREVKLTIPFTFDEPNHTNLNKLFFGSETVSDEAAYSTPVAGEPHILTEEIPVYLEKLNSSGTVTTVKDETDTTTYVLDTDYTVTTLGKRIAVARIEGGAIADGDEVHVSYTPAVPARKVITPLGKTERTGRALLMAVSDTGNEFEWDIPKVSFRPDGELSYNDQDWSTFQGILQVLSDGSSFPYGKVYDYGTDSDI